MTLHTFIYGLLLFVLDSRLFLQRKQCANLCFTTPKKLFFIFKMDQGFLGKIFSFQNVELAQTFFIAIFDVHYYYTSL